MRVLFLYPRSTTRNGNSAFDWLDQCAELMGIELTVSFFEDVVLDYPLSGDSLLIGGEVYPLPDVALLRGYNLALGLHLEALGVRVLNGALAMEYSRNKLLTHQILSRRGLPSPRTIYSAEYDYDWVREELGGTFVAKSLVGSKGEGVYLVESLADFSRVLDSHTEVLVQEYLPSSRGRDIRVWVIGGEVAGAVLRYNPDSFLSNFSQGGRVEAIADLPDEVTRLAIESTHALGLDFAGVDILFTDEGYTVCEVNANAGFRTHSLVNSSDQRSIPYQLFSYISTLKI